MHTAAVVALSVQNPSRAEKCEGEQREVPARNCFLQFVSSYERHDVVVWSLLVDVRLSQTYVSHRGSLSYKADTFLDRFLFSTCYDNKLPKTAMASRCYSNYSKFVFVACYHLYTALSAPNTGLSTE